MNSIYKRMQYLMLLVVVAFSMFAVSCSDDSNPTDNNKVNEAELLVNYIEAGNNYINTAAPAITTADKLKMMDPAKTYIIDIRKAEDFAKGYIKGAVNVTLTDLVNHVQGLNVANYDNIVIVCYSGQTAAYGASILRLFGYENVSSLKFGMSSWHTDFAGSWKNGAKNSRATEFVSTVTELPTTTYAYPALKTGKTTATAILNDRVNTLLTEGFDVAKITADQVFADLNKYYIINYWPMNHYTDPGHIPGAYQFTPKEAFKSSTLLKNLPTDKTIVVYCYTGQTSAAVTAYLRMLGYDAKSLLFGTSGMINDIAAQKDITHWDDKYVMDYEYEK